MSIQCSKRVLVLYILLLVSVLYFILIPVLSVVFYGLSSDDGLGTASQGVGRALLYLQNSLKVSVPVTLIATSVGLITALTLWRLKFWGRALMRLLVLFPLINPPFVGSIAFILLFGKRGLITHNLLGLAVSPFGYYGIVVMQSIGLSTLAYLIIFSAIRKINVDYEEAARNLGASEGRIFLSVTLPLMAPEITVAAMLVFLSSMSDFGTPLIIGGRYQTLASDLYLQITGLYNMRTASLSGIFLLIPCLLAFSLQKYSARRQVYSSQAVSRESIVYAKVHPAVKCFLIGFTGLFILFILTKYGFIALGAFTERWGYDHSLTLRHLRKVLTNERAPFINSVKLALGTAFVSSFLGVILAYILKTRKLFFSKQVDFLATLPAAVPGILFGIGYLVTFKYPLCGVGRFIFPEMPAVILLGTNFIIYIICIYRYLYVGLKTGYALMEHFDPNLELAAHNLGAGELKTFFYIIFPQLKPAFTAAFLKNFTSTMTTLGAIIFLLLPKNKVATQQILQIATSSEIGVAAMLALMLSLLSLTFLILFQILINHREIISWCKTCRARAKNLYAGKLTKKTQKKVFS
jgi:iron(III) transport system permease protein